MHRPVEPVRSSITESSQAFLKLTAAGNLIVMAGSPKIGQIATQIGENNVSFWKDHLEPFVTRYTQLPNPPGANDPAGWEKDSAALAGAIEDL
jgi:hypothetical protein